MLGRKLVNDSQFGDGQVFVPKNAKKRQPKPKRVGIFAGTFDPIHIGHIRSSLGAMNTHKLDQVVLLVEPRPRKKQNVTPVKHRKAMAKIAAKVDNRLKIEDIKHSQFNVEKTLPQLKKLYPRAKLHLILGSDVFLGLPNWEKLDKLVQNVEFIVLGRNDAEEDLAKTAAEISDKVNRIVHYKVYKSVHPDVSSTVVKQQLREGAPEECLHPEVLEYIKINKLYDSSTGT